MAERSPTPGPAITTLEVAKSENIMSIRCRYSGPPPLSATDQMHQGRFEPLCRCLTEPMASLTAFLITRRSTLRSCFLLAAWHTETTSHHPACSSSDRERPMGLRPSDVWTCPFCCNNQHPASSHLLTRRSSSCIFRWIYFHEIPLQAPHTVERVQRLGHMLGQLHQCVEALLVSLRPARVRQTITHGSPYRRRAWREMRILSSPWALSRCAWGQTCERFHA
jgi:hypothetical protein